MHGTRSCVPPRYGRALPLGSHRHHVNRQRPTASCHPRSAACDRAALCASGLGGCCEQHLVRRRGVLEQHAEHHQDGVEGSHHLWRAVGAVSAHTPASAWDGTLEAHQHGYIAEAGRGRPRPLTARQHTAPCRVCCPHLSGPLRRRQRLAMYPHSSWSRILTFCDGFVPLLLGLTPKGRISTQPKEFIENDSRDN